MGIQKYVSEKTNAFAKERFLQDSEIMHLLSILIDAENLLQKSYGSPENSPKSHRNISLQYRQFKIVHNLPLCS